MIGFAAVNTGNNLLFLVLSGLLAFMSVTGVAGWVNLRTGTITLTLPDELFAGIPSPLTVTVTNPSRVIPLFLLRIDSAWGSGRAGMIQPGGSGSVTIPFTPPRRGHLPPVPLTISSRYPVGFFVRSRTVTPPATGIVFPHPLSSPIPVTGEERGSEGERQTLRGGGGDVMTIRDYLPGDPLRSIHWRISAREERFRVTERSIESGAPVIIDPSRVAGASPEERISRATARALEGFRQGRAVGLRLGDRLIPPCRGRACRHAILTELALHELP